MSHPGLETRRVDGGEVTTGEAVGFEPGFTSMPSIARGAIPDSDAFRCFLCLKSD